MRGGDGAWEPSLPVLLHLETGATVIATEQFMEL